MEVDDPKTNGKTWISVAGSGKLVVDIFTKPLQGSAFRILNLPE